MITYGVITGGGHREDIFLEFAPEARENRLNIFVDSIEAQQLKTDYEVIVVGDSKLERKNTTVLPFDESIKVGWITKKKNIIANAAKYDIIVIVHDYIRMSPDFSEIITKEFDSDIAMCQILRKNGIRSLDWAVSNFRDNSIGRNIPHCGLLDYKDYSQLPYMFIPGNLIICRKKVLLEEPLKEDLLWGQMEDIEWSNRVLAKYTYKFINTWVRYTKDNK